MLGVRKLHAPQRPPTAPTEMVYFYSHGFFRFCLFIFFRGRVCVQELGEEPGEAQRERDKQTPPGA